MASKTKPNSFEFMAYKVSNTALHNENIQLNIQTRLLSNLKVGNWLIDKTIMNYDGRE